jgi:hypothetical protein
MVVTLPDPGQNQDGSSPAVHEWITTGPEPGWFKHGGPWMDYRRGEPGERLDAKPNPFMLTDFLADLTL